MISRPEFHCTYTQSFAAAPGVPQSVSAAEISPPIGDTCIILVTWDPPANTDESNIDHYIVYVPSRNIMNDIFFSSTISTLTVPNCHDGVRIQVAAMNRFGCRGPYHEVKPSQLEVPTVPTGNGSASTTEGGPAASK